MSLDPPLLGALATTAAALVATVGVVLRHDAVLRTIESVRRRRGALRQVREQRRIAQRAMLRLQPGMTIIHVTPDGGRLSMWATRPTATTGEGTGQ